MAVPVPSLDAMRRPVVTLSVKPGEAFPLAQELLCHIDTGADPALTFRNHEKARRFGLVVSDRSAYVGDPEGWAHVAHGPDVHYLVDFLLITEWIDGNAKWVKVFVPPMPETSRSVPGGEGPLSEVPQDYREPEALLGLDLLESADFRLNIAEQVVELRSLR